MKTRIGYLVIVSLLLVSCGEEFLNAPPPTNISTGNFYNNPDDFNQAILGAYSSLQSHGQYSEGFFLTMEERSDNTDQHDDNFRNDVNTFSLTPTNTVMAHVWSATYNGIMKANQVLDNIEGVSMEESFKNQITGEAQFLRGLTYFHLVRLFGEVPLVLSAEGNPAETGYEFGRTSVDSVYNQIITDLSNAEANLPISYPPSDQGRATKGAAQALLGQVYLTQENWSEAVAQFQKVINSGNYDLLNDYAALWNPGNKNNEESIFQVMYSGSPGREGGELMSQMAPKGSGTNVVPLGGTAGENRPTPDLINAYADEDLRFDSSVDTGYVDQATGEFVPEPYGKKYITSEIFSSGNATYNFYILRYGGVLLYCAEALNEQGYSASGEAFSYLNEVRERAGLPAYTAADLPNQEVFRQAVYEEERLELALENQRWFNLVRTGRALEVMDEKHPEYNVQEFQLIYPIPQTQIDINPDLLSQNPGY